MQNSLLHEKIRQIAKNETVSKLLRGLRFHFVRLQYQTLFKPGRMDRSMKEHRDIVTAICSGDVDRAGEAMWKHLESIKESIQWYSERSMADARPELLSAGRRL
jgi:DNA-binding FadR family transcriptional regulator